MAYQLSQKALHEFAKLKQKKFRDLQNAFLVSGLRAVQGALEAGTELPIALIHTPEMLREIKSLAGDRQLPVYITNKPDFNRLSDEKNPQGIALVMRRPTLDLAGIEVNEKLSIYLEQVNDPGNLGTIVRSALWFGVTNILLSPNSSDPFQPKVVRASAGYVGRARIYESVGLEELAELKRKFSLSLSGAVMNSELTLNKLAHRQDMPAIIAFGSEAHGMSTGLQELCDLRFTIPKKGIGESLNLAVAVALSLAQLTNF